MFTASWSTTLREVSIFANVDARLRRWLAIRGFAMARFAVAGVGAGGEGGFSAPAGLDFAVDLVGEL